jgi:hypothetical protein
MDIGSPAKVGQMERPYFKKLKVTGSGTKDTTEVYQIFTCLENHFLVLGA